MLYYFIAGTRQYYATVRINRGSASFMWACGLSPLLLAEIGLRSQPQAKATGELYQQEI